MKPNKSELLAFESGYKAGALSTDPEIAEYTEEEKRGVAISTWAKFLDCLPEGFEDFLRTQMVEVVVKEEEDDR